MHHRR